MKKSLVVIILVLCWFHVSSQIKWVDFKNSGHYSDAFSAIAFDNENNPWVGTISNGIHYFNLKYYDSYNVLNSPLPNNKIYDLLYSQDNQLWIATANGLALFKENSWTIYDMENSNLPSNTIISLSQGIGGRIWIGTDKGAIDGINGMVFNRLNTPMSGDIIYHIFTDSKGDTWFATNEEVAKLSGESWQIFNHENTILPDEISLFIEEDNSELIWVSFGNTYSGTLASFDDETWNIYDNSVIYNLSSRISSIATFNDGTSWFGTHDKGLIRHKDSEWTAFTTDNSDISINQIICMKKDRENNLWLGHRNGLTKVQVETEVSANTISVPELVVFPNPIKDKATIVIPPQKNMVFRFEVINSYGNTVHRIENVNQGFYFERNNLDSGLYFFKLYNTEQTFLKKVILN